jgi:hypothetical protein
VHQRGPLLEVREALLSAGCACAWGGMTDAASTSIASKTASYKGALTVGFQDEHLGASLFLPPLQLYGPQNKYAALRGLKELASSEGKRPPISPNQENEGAMPQSPVCARS